MQDIPGLTRLNCFVHLFAGLKLVLYYSFKMWKFTVVTCLHDVKEIGLKRVDPVLTQCFLSKWSEF